MTLRRQRVVCSFCACVSHKLTVQSVLFAPNSNLIWLSVWFNNNHNERAIKRKLGVEIYEMDCGWVLGTTQKLSLSGVFFMHRYARLAKKMYIDPILNKHNGLLETHQYPIYNGFCSFLLTTYRHRSWVRCDKKSVLVGICGIKWRYKRQQAYYSNSTLERDRKEWEEKVVFQAFPTTQFCAEHILYSLCGGSIMTSSSRRKSSFIAVSFASHHSSFIHFSLGCMLFPPAVCPRYILLLRWCRPQNGKSWCSAFLCNYWQYNFDNVCNSIYYDDNGSEQTPIILTIKAIIYMENLQHYDYYQAENWLVFCYAKL